MEKIFKKSLALVLSAALCLTALVGCLTVSAADETTTPIVAGNYKVNNAEGVVGKTAEIFADYTDISTICAHYVEVTFPAGITVNAVLKQKTQLSEGSDATETIWVPLTAYSGANDGWDYKPTTNEDGTTVIESCEIINFLKADNKYDEENPSIHLKFDVTIDKNLTPGDYNVTVAVKQAATQAEEWVAPTTVGGVITVKAESAETYTVIFKDEDGTELSTQQVEKGKAAVAPENPRKLFYLFDKWDKDFSNITENTVVTAVYKEPVETNLGISARLILGDTFGLKFTYLHSRAGVTDLSQLSDIYLKVTKETYNDNVAGADIKVLKMSDCELNAKNDNGQSVFAFTYLGISAKEMSDNISAQFYYVVDGVLYTSKVGTTTVAKMTLSQMVKDESVRTIGMDILNYGATAQEYFGYRTDSLANQVKNSTAKASDYADYATVTNPTITRDISTSGTHLNGAGLSISLILGNSVGLNVKITQGTNVFDESTILRYSYTRVDGKNITKEVDFSKWSKSSTEGKFEYVISDLAAKDLRQKITFAVYDSNNDPITKIATTSIAGYLAGQLSNPDNMNLVYALMKYSDSARAYFS